MWLKFCSILVSWDEVELPEVSVPASFRLLVWFRQGKSHPINLFIHDSDRIRSHAYLVVGVMFAAITFTILLFLPPHQPCIYIATVFMRGQQRNAEDASFDKYSERDFHAESKSGCVIICHGQNSVRFQQGLTGLQRRLQGEGGRRSASKHVLFLISCVRR